MQEQKLLAKCSNCDVAICQKNREQSDIVNSMHLIGDVKGKTAILMDDIISTGGTMCAAAKLLMTNGATEVYACISHGTICRRLFKKY